MVIRRDMCEEVSVLVPSVHLRNQRLNHYGIARRGQAVVSYWATSALYTLWHVYPSGDSDIPRISLRLPLCLYVYILSRVWLDCLPSVWRLYARHEVFKSVCCSRCDYVLYMGSSSRSCLGYVQLQAVNWELCTGGDACICIWSHQFRKHRSTFLKVDEASWWVRFSVQ